MNTVKYQLKISGIDEITKEKLKILIQSHLSKLLVPILEEKDGYTEDFRSNVSDKDHLQQQENLAKDLAAKDNIAILENIENK